MNRKNPKACLFLNMESKRMETIDRSVETSEIWFFVNGTVVAFMSMMEKSECMDEEVE